MWFILNVAAGQQFRGWRAILCAIFFLILKMSAGNGRSTATVLRPQRRHASPGQQGEPVMAVVVPPTRPNSGMMPVPSGVRLGMPSPKFAGGAWVGQRGPA